MNGFFPEISMIDNENGDISKNQLSFEEMNN